MQTVISVFDDLVAAQKAVDRLVDAGFDRNDLHLEGAPAVPPGPATGSPEAQLPYRTYTEALQTGHTQVWIEVEDAGHAQQACLLLGACGALHVHVESSAHV